MENADAFPTAPTGPTTGGKKTHTPLPRTLLEQLAAWPPGERFHYSNVGYQVLHVLLEKVSGRSWAKNVVERILRPLGMAASELAIAPSNRDRQAVGYLPALADRPHHVSRPLVRAPFVEYSFGDGCIVATASDMASYLRMLLRRGQGPEGRILSASSFAAFATPWIRPWKATGYGYGIAVREKDGLQLLHAGRSLGASAMIAADLASGIGVAVMLTGPGDPQSLALFALDTLKAAMAGEALPDPPVRTDPVRVEGAGELAGTYRSPDGSTLVFVADRERLSLLHQGRAIALEARGDGTFSTIDPGFDRFYLRFEKDEQGRVVELTHGPRWFAREGRGEPVDPPHPAGWRAYEGRYLSHSPWFPGFLVFVRKGQLWAVKLGGGESEAGEEIRLEPLGGGLFRPGEEASPERLVFADAVDGEAWSATWSGHRFYRAGIDRIPGAGGEPRGSERARRVP